MAGTVFVALGAAFAVGSLAYDVGSLLAMGPGYVPLVLGGVLVALGVATVVKAYVGAPAAADAPVGDAPGDGSPADAPGDDEDAGDDRPLAGLRWRPLVLVTAAVAFFAYTVDGLGLLPAAFGAGLLAALADSGTRWLRALLIAACLTAASYVIFVLLLQLRLSLLGPWLGG